MVYDNITPEQKAKFMLSGDLSGIDTISNTSAPKKNRFLKMLPALAGIFVAGVVLLLGINFLSNKGAVNLLSPFATGDDSKGGIKGPTVTNPLTGEIVAEADAMEWKDARPIGVMMNNHLDSRPQFGLVDADLIYEVVAEGGITRYLAFFLSKLPEKIGTVRSTREYYLVLVKEMGDAMLMHIGWSPQALTAIETWPVRSLGRGGAEFSRDQERLNNGIAIEHTAYVNGPYLRELGNKLGWEGKREFDMWQFKDETKITSTEQCLVLECKPLVIDFWFKGDYTGAFKYDRASNSYLRFSGYDESDQLKALMDPATGKQVTVKNVVVQFAAELTIDGDEKGRLDYQLIGSGQALIFRDGEVAKAIWRKESRDGRTKFFGEDGKEILFNRGKIWVSIVPDRNMEQVVY